MLRRFAVMAACLWLVACATTSEPTRRKKRKKRKTDDTELKEDEGRVARKNKKTGEDVRDEQDDDDGENDDDDRPRKKTAQREETPAQKRARIKKRKQQEAEERKRREDERRKQEDAEREEAAAEEERREREAEKRSKRRSDKDRDDDDDRKQRAAAEREAAEVREREAKKQRAAEAKKQAEAKRRADAEAKKRAKKRPAEEVEGPVIDMTGDEEAGGGSPDEPRAEAIAVPGVDSSVEAASEPEAAASPSMPASGTLNQRPLTLGKGKAEVHGGLQISVLTLPGAMPGTEVSTTTTSLAFGGSYGVSDDLEVGGDYALALSPFEIQGPLSLRAAYSLKRGKLDVALASAFAVDFETFVDPTTMASTTQTFTSLQLGGWVRYHATPKLSLFTGLPALPPSSVTLTKLALPLPPFTYQLQLGLSGGITRALELPVGVGVQATPSIYMFATLNLAHIRIANTVNALLFADFIPLGLGAFYTKHKLDVGIVFSDDLKQGFDYLRLDTVVRYSL